MIDALVLGTIGIYQRYISPRKGWRCAYSVLHGGTGCSGYIKGEIQQHGWREARVAAKRRFKECKLAGQALRARAMLVDEGLDSERDPFEKEPFEKESSKKDHWRRSRGCWFEDWRCFQCCEPDFCFVFNILTDCGPCDTGCIDCTPCDCTP